MRTFMNAVLACTLMTMVLALSGCNHHDQYEQTYVAPPPPPTPYTIIDVKEKGFSYAILQEGTVTTKEIDQWKALSPELFAKLSGVTVTAPAPDKTEHAGYGYLLPKIETSSQYPERKMTGISANYLVPKELNGWVAVSNDSFEKLAHDFMSAGAK